MSQKVRIEIPYTITCFQFRAAQHDGHKKKQKNKKHKYKDSWDRKE